MNRHELLTLIQSCQTIFAFLVDRGLLAAKRDCTCGNEMVLRERPNSEDGYHWECPVRCCRKRRSIRAGSFFEDSKIPLEQWLFIIFLWSMNESSNTVSRLTGLSLRNSSDRTSTAVRCSWNPNYLRQVFAVFQSQSSWLHPSHGEPLGELCGSLHRSPHEHDRGSLESGEEEAEGNGRNSQEQTSGIPG